MTLKNSANILASQIGNMINGKAQSWEVEPLLTKKAMQKHGRVLEPGCIALRVLIVADLQAGDLGRMELFAPVDKKRLKEQPSSVFSSVARFIGTAAAYRSEMIGKVKERVTQ